MSDLLAPEALERRLREVGETRYHHLHPFQLRLQSGECSRGEVEAWALNRYLYQACIPQKDAHILARMEDAGMRREWRQRIIDHDGEREGEGGIAKWLKLTDDLGLDRADVMSGRLALPATKFAVNAYLSFVKDRSLLEAIASSLTELFSPMVIKTRVAGMLSNYDYVTPETLAYFTARPVQAKRDSDFALAYVLENARTPAEQQAAIGALEFKCSMLWAMLDALEHAYIYAQPWPDAFKPADAVRREAAE
ncbi:pyrroloquinoline-quinone synthase PqqC [Hansschlegelia zhihuaiae]|uniref:Pyrroloquinoline-quinone synthase n=1 Tax=Hansschlegelia zhihuaiae TaxID=405005 RepID=A0A4Q0MLT7_9HYPH|nr:pyrroloquinoline-quinone synthase PqqC [Hansschlegelia zhihuaiae]RXF74678.1 pyrroloquinoline quinone biosynthesis protein PqqC [Hansschlegelia zhihuaiae]